MHIDNSGPLIIENVDSKGNYIAGDSVDSINYYCKSSYNCDCLRFLVVEAV